MRVKTDILNFIIYRYFQEVGYEHSSFILFNEANLSSVKVDRIKPGALLSVIEKGIKFTEAESWIMEDGTIQKSDRILTLEDVVIEHEESREQFVNSSEASGSAGKAIILTDDIIIPKCKDKGTIQQSEKILSLQDLVIIDEEKVVNSSEASGAVAEVLIDTVSNVTDDTVASLSKDTVGTIQQSESILSSQDIEKTGDEQIVNISSESTGSVDEAIIDTVSNVTDDTILSICKDKGRIRNDGSRILTFRGHMNEVYSCNFNPTNDLMVTGSSDGTGIIWDMSKYRPDPYRILKHESEHVSGSSFPKDVTSLQWNFDGKLLATSGCDGCARIWTKNGDLLNTFHVHQGPIIVLKWNKRGKYLLSAAADGISHVWNGMTGETIQKYRFHSGSILDCDWQTTDTFASCGSDLWIYVCKLNVFSPIISFHGHTKEINTLLWCPQGNLLASGSDDNTVKIWSMSQDTCIHDLLGHTQNVYTMNWSPGGPNLNGKLILASASFDHTIRIWDVAFGTCLSVLTKHTAPVYTVAFSPLGQYCATGGFDNFIYIWCSNTWQLITSFHCPGGIFNLCWNWRGTKIGAACNNSMVLILDLKKN